MMVAIQIVRIAWVVPSALSYLRHPTPVSSLDNTAVVAGVPAPPPPGTTNVLLFFGTHSCLSWSNTAILCYIWIIPTIQFSFWMMSIRWLICQGEQSNERSSVGTIWSSPSTACRFVLALCTPSRQEDQVLTIIKQTHLCILVPSQCNTILLVFVGKYWNRIITCPHFPSPYTDV